MPRLTESLPAYRLHKASGQAVVTLHGRAVYLGVHGTRESRQEYNRVIAEWLANGRQFPRNESISVAELCVAYLRFATKHYAKPDGTLSDEVDCVRSSMRPLKQLYSRTPAAQFGPVALKAVRQKMIATGWSRGYINRSIGRLKRVFKWGVENELVPPSVHQALSAVAGLRAGRSDARETAPRTPVPPEHVESVRAIVSPLVRDLIDLQLFTGARPGELLGLKTGDIDMRGKVWVARLRKHKTEYLGKERWLIFGPKSQEILRRYLKADRDAKLFGITGDGFRVAITDACAKAGIPRWTPHWLRHTAATRLREEFGLEVAQVMLGHSELQTTQVYAERNLRLATEVAERVG